METATQEQVDSAVKSYFDTQAPANGEVLKAAVVAGLLFVGTYTTAKFVARGIAATYSAHKERKQLKKMQKES